MISLRTKLMMSFIWMSDDMAMWIMAGWSDDDLIDRADLITDCDIDNQLTH